jgi:phosphoglycerate kinase
MVFTFRKAAGHQIGNSLVEEDKLELAKELMEKFGDKLYISEDSVAGPEFADVEGKVMDEIEDGYMGLDIGPKTIEDIKGILSDAKTVI